VCLTATVWLTGCALGTASFPDTTPLGASATSGVSSFGSIQGSNYGGHAPIVGAHVFLLQAGTGGYGSVATSLLGAGETGNADYYGNTFPTNQDSTTGSPTSGMYYVTTDAFGVFNLTGTGYTCTPGLPVYLYAQGGNPQTVPTFVTPTAATITGSGSPYTLQVTATNLLYQGEQITFTGSGDANSLGKYLNGDVLTVQADANLTTTTFDVQLTSLTRNGVTLTTGSQTDLGTITAAETVVPSSNPAIVNLAVLGVCPQAGPAVNITQVTSSQSGGDLLVTFTNSGTNQLVAGEKVTFGTIPSPYNAFSGTTQTVSTLLLTPTTFSVLLGPGGTLGTVAAMSTATPAQGNLTSLPFVYMNEVSTAAAAYALAGFFPAPGTAGLANPGAVAANLSIPASDTLALTGIQNATITADQIYDILGTVMGTGGDGETHIARTTTPGEAVYAATTNGSTTVSVASTVGLHTGITITGSGIPANTTISAINTPAETITLSAAATATATNVLLRAGAGNGTVPQTLLNTVGNILANCVDSSNTYNPYTTLGTATTQCSSLFTDAPSAGTIGSGTKPVDTASAAIDIAHNPWANVSALASLPTGNAPFQPSLNSQGGTAAQAINDFSVGIAYTPTHVGIPQGIAVDGSGLVWYTNFANGYLTALSAVGGVVYNVQHAPADFLGYVAIDPSGNAWYGDITASAVSEVSAAGVYVNAYDAGNLTQPYGVASDSIGHIYVENINVNSVDEFTNAGALTTAPANPLTGASTCGANTYHADHIATDNATNGPNMWYTSELGDFVCEVNSTTGALVHETAINAGQGLGNTYSPEFIGIDANGAAWFPDQQHDGMNKVTQGGVLSNPTGGTISGGFGTAVDGAGNVFVTNRTSNSITEYLGATSTAVSATNFEGGGNATVMSDPLNVSMDLSGNLWIANYTGNKIVELVGIGAPTYMPLSAAAAANKLGSKP
jgi:hypothetical protein